MVNVTMGLWEIETEDGHMTLVKEQLIKMIPEMPNLIQQISDEQAEQVINILITIKKSPSKQVKRTFGSMKDSITYVSEDFDSCIDDDPALLGLEEYM